MASKNYVILDCDGGSDDAWALLLLLKAEAENHLSILGITICGSGNTTLHNAAYNVLRILKACRRDEVLFFENLNFICNVLIICNVLFSRFRFFWAQKNLCLTHMMVKKDPFFMVRMVLVMFCHRMKI